MSRNNSNNSLRNGLLIKLQQNVEEILCGIGVIHQGNEQLTEILHDLKKAFEKHLSDHSEKNEIMGALPFLRKMGKKHWRILFVSWVLAQIGIAALIVKYGIERIIK